MPATFDGVDEKDLVFCDPQCKKHTKGRVSPRVRRGCIHRIKLATAREKAAARRQAAKPSEASASTSSAPQPLPLPLPLNLDFAGSVNAFLARQSVPPVPPSDLDEQLDTTLPSWGIPPDGDDLFEAEIDTNPPTNDANPPMDDEGDAWTEIPPGYDAAMEPDSTDVGYTSGSETDAESDHNMHLDGLEYISPASSPTFPPIAEQRPTSPCNLDVNLSQDQMSEHDSAPDNQNPPPVATAEQPSPDSEPPDALRAFREWVLKLSSSSDLTVKGANSLLHTLDMLLEKDLLRCGPDSNPDHRLPRTLATLQQNVDKAFADPMKVYAMCPDFECQTLRDLESMESDRSYKCTKCKKEITRKKAIRRRGARKTSYRHLPIIRYCSGSVAQQLQAILSRPGIREAIIKHRKHLQRPGRDPDTLEDIQDGEIWRNLSKGDFKFFENLENIG
ncbi:hypothetical protein FRC09_018762, partial [Ceratobasidium sp. 395]